jgi:ribosomal protein L7/L12
MNIQLSNVNRQQFVALVSDANTAGQVYDSLNNNCGERQDYNHLKKVCRETVRSLYQYTYKTDDKIKAIKLVRAIVAGYAGTDHPLYNLVDAKHFVEDLKPADYSL